MRYARFPSHRLRPFRVSDSSLHSRPPSPTGNSVQNDGVVFDGTPASHKLRSIASISRRRAVGSAALRRGNFPSIKM